MGSAALLLTLSIISLLTPPSTAALGFTCNSTGSCRALIDYVSPNTTYLSVINTRFGIKYLDTLLGANNYPAATSSNQIVIAGDTIKIPIPCICTNGSGISNKVPIYTVQPNDSLDHIAVDVFSRLVTYQQIQEANNIYNPNLIVIGQNLTIPLPCSCDAVNGLEVVHYGHVVKSGNSVEQIAEEYATTQETLLQLNGLTDPKDLQAGAVLDVPLKVCSSKVQNDSLDYPLLVSNNTYVYTANNCVECKCDSANDWTLQCDPAQISTANGTCPSMQCQLGSNSLYIGNTTSSSSCNSTMCAYAGYYANQTILTTIVNESICPESMGNSRQRHKRIVIAILVSTFSGILLLGLVCLWRIDLVSTISGILLLELVCLWRIIREKRRKRRGEERDNPERDNPERSYTTEDLELPLFNLAAVSKATKNFSFNNKLGEGGFGPVYKGVLEDGQEIAVKRLSVNSRQGLNEFKNEAIHIVKLQHRNLVTLLGCCIQGDEKMLIYEFMPNKSLDFIFDRTQSILLDWPRRFHIINGIAQGLLYLHRDSRLRIIHRDLKASNILLDNEMNPKISDFGLARSFGGSESPANTNKVVGTYGYMSPEYAIDGLYSVKSDVFSFGVLLLEVVSGKRNRGFYHPEHHLNLIGHAWRLHIEGRSLEMMDESIRDSHNLSEVLRSIHVGLLCVQRDPEDRPSMSSVVLMLGGEGALPQPRQPGFYNERNPVEGDSSSVMREAHSANEITITLLQP